MKFSILIVFLFFIFHDAFAQCDIQGFPEQMLQNSTRSYQISPNAHRLTVLDYISYPLNPSLDNNSDDSDGVTSLLNLGGGSSGYVHSGNTLGIYMIKIQTSSTCIDTVELNVVESLPVTWLHPSTVKIDNNKAQISWSVASQINNEKFVVEHSQDWKKFLQIGEVAGAGNSSQIIEYEYIDDRPLAQTNYYRIKQVDNDGQSSYSNVTSVLYNVHDVSIYPNPVSNILTVNSPLKDNLDLYNHLGQVVLSQSLYEGQNEINMSRLSGGVYYARFGSGTVERILKE